MMVAVFALLLAATPAALAPVPEAASRLSELSGRLSGTWTLLETPEPDAGQPQRPERRGELRWWMPEAGLPLRADFHVGGEGGDEHASSSVWWDAGARQYRGMFCAAYSTPGCSAFTVSLSEKQVVLKGSYQLGGKIYRWTDVYTFETPDAFELARSVETSDAPLRRVSTIRGNRAKSKAP